MKQTEVQARCLKTMGAAHYLAVSGSYLRKLRAAGTGPAWIKLSHGIVVYEIAALDSWLDQCRLRQPAHVMDSIDSPQAPLE